MSNTTVNSMQNTFKANSEKMNLGFHVHSVPSSSSTTRENFSCPENEIKHGIRTIRQCTFIIQQPNSSNHVNQDELSKNIFICATSCQHNYQNTQPFSVFQSSTCSWQGDLSNAYHGFVNSENRKLTKSAKQCRFRCCLVVL